MKKVVSVMVLQLFLLVSAYSQIEFGVTIGTNYGSAFETIRGHSTDRTIFGIGWNVNGILKLSKGRGAFQLLPGLNNIYSPWKIAHKFRKVNDGISVVFAECPMIYDFNIYKNLRIGGGITNSVLLSTTDDFGDEFGKNPYFFGLIGSLVFVIDEHLNFNLSYRNIGFTQSGENFRHYQAFGLNMSWFF